MAMPSKGELVPVGGGDIIPLIREHLTLGRRESCDICFRYPNVSSTHCEFSFRDGYWFVRDLNSTNGTKVNGMRVVQKVLLPGDEVSIAKRRYTVRYTLAAGRRALEEIMEDDIMAHTLLERAGLAKREEREERKSSSAPRHTPDEIEWEDE